ncbi:MAG: hypothetical protein SOT60_02460 [Bilifractor sp.]|nr:hypothetical protein [Lachnospiraceae bacterium]MDY2836785.1 hypothetical protein [Bilifractor sp.]
MRNTKIISVMKFAGCLAVFVAVLLLLDLMLYPCTYVRNDLHALTTEQDDVLILGTSNSRMGIDPDTMLKGTGKTGRNLANGGEYLCDSYYLLKLAVEKNRPSTVILDVDPGYLVTEKEKGNNYLLFYHEFPVSRAKFSYLTAIMPQSDFRALLFPSYEYPLKSMIGRIPSNLRVKLGGDYSSGQFSTANMRYHENGFIERYPVSEDKFPGWNPVLFETDQVKEDNIAYLEKIIRLCRDHDIRLVTTTLPQPDRSLVSFPENYEAAWDYLSSFMKKNNVKYFNFNREYYDSFSHDVTGFVDYDGHMNGESAEQFSALLGKMLFSTNS